MARSIIRGLYATVLIFAFRARFLAAEETTALQPMADAAFRTGQSEMWRDMNSAATPDWLVTPTV